jgi:L-lactate dehydrogenase complex protein LldG
VVAPDPGAVVTGLRHDRTPPPSARDVVLARIRTALGGQRSTVDIPRAYRRTGEHQPGAPALLELLTERLRDYRATVRPCAEAEVPATIASALPDGSRVIVPAGLPSGWAPSGAVLDDPAYDAFALDGFDAVVTGCAAAAAETGTIALDGTAGQGRRAISLIPDRHVCVVRAEQVVQTVPELLARLDPTRPLTLVSGPSATSDIELQRVEGVHGPRTLIVVLVATVA